MASANFLEEALSTDVDESAVSAIVGSLENTLVTSSPASSNISGSITTGIKNHVNSAISNGSSVSTQKHGLSLAAGPVNNILLSDANKTSTVQTSNLGQVKVLASVAGEVTNKLPFANQVTSSIGLTQTTLSNLMKGEESVRILHPPSSQAPSGMNINNTRLPLTTQHVGALQNGNVALTSLPAHSVVNPATTIVAPNQVPSITNVNKQITGVVNALEQAKAAGATLVIKTSGNQLANQVSIASAVMPVSMSVNSTVPMTATSINSVSGSTVTTSTTGIMTLSKPLTQAMGTAQGNILSGNLQVLNLNALRPTAPGVGPKGAQRVVIGNPLGSRPGAQGQLTLSALQGQGLLLKTENGHFQLLRVGPAHTGAGTNVSSTNTVTPAGQTLTTPSGQTIRIQSFPTLGSVPVSTASAATGATSVQTTPVPVPALATPAPAPAPAPAPSSVVQAPRPPQVDTTKEKCRKFLANLLELSSREPKSVEKNVRLLIQELVDCKVEPEEFCERLERLLNASPQPCLIGFLKKSLPLLRQALVTKELVIDGIRPPPANVVFSNSTAAVVSCPPLQATQIRPSGINQAVRLVTPINVAGAASPTVVGGMPGPRHVTVQQHRLVNPLQLVSSAVPGTVNKVLNQLTHTVMAPHVPNTSAPVMVPSSTSTVSMVTPQPSSIASTIPMCTAPTVPVSVSSPLLCRPGAPGSLVMPARTLMPIKQTTTNIRHQTPIIRAQSPIIRATAPVRVATPVNKSTTIQKSTPKLTAAQQRMQAKMLNAQSQGSSSTVQIPPVTTVSSSTVSNNLMSTIQAVATGQAGLGVNSSSLSDSNSSSSVTSAPAPTPVVVPQPPVTSVAVPVVPTTSSVLSQPATTVPPSTPTSQPVKIQPKEKEKKSFSSSSTAYTGDDDINDVAAMGGVNLAEESQRILGSTEFVGTQIRSCKDEIFLHNLPLQQKIKKIAADHGLEESTPDVAALISHAAQERLKNLVEKLAVIAEHRLDVIKLDPRYEVTQDVKGQLKFLEELDRMERKRHEEKERELLLRAAKSRSKTEDPEQAKLKAKAKEMQRAEAEEVRQREANMTALQAIGPRKKPRLDGPFGDGNVPSPGSSTSVTSNGSAANRPQIPTRSRLKRVNLRDLVFLLEQEKESSRSTFLYKAYLK